MARKKKKAPLIEINPYIHLEDSLKDKRFLDMLDIDHSWQELLELYSKDDFLTHDTNVEIPFFANIRDYTGARNELDPEGTWLIKPITPEEELEFTLSMYSYFIHFMTGNFAAPSIITVIDGVTYRASKEMKRTEQLSGAPYLENKPMRDQLILDTINSWICYDQDRNPNNYLVYYTEKNYPAIIAIDFSMGDLLAKEPQVFGLQDTFGWTRTGKNRYLTPLKTELFYTYQWEFFSRRFQSWYNLTTDVLTTLGNSIFRNHPDKKKFVVQIADNIQWRRDYVYDYFYSWFADPERLKQLNSRTFDDMKDEYSLMGKSFNSLQQDFEN